MNKHNEEFDRVFQKYYNDLCVFAYRYVYSRDVAEDIVQGLFCQFLESGTVFRLEDGEASLRSYLYTCVRNRAIDSLRNAGNRHSRIDDYIENIKLELYVENMLINRAEEYDYRVLLTEVRLAISLLPLKTKRVFLMSRLQDKSNKEIAILLDVSVKAVEKHITKAIAFIRVHLRKRMEINC